MQVAIDAVAAYQKRVTALQRQIAEWLSSRSGISVSYADGTISEDLVGTYPATVMHVMESDRLIATFRPVGAFVVAAQGRVDIEGPVDRAILLWFSNPRVEMSVADDAGQLITKMSTPVLSGVDAPGWYGLSSGSRHAVALTEASLLELLAEVSDRDFAAK